MKHTDQERNKSQQAASNLSEHLYLIENISASCETDPPPIPVLSKNKLQLILSF